MFRISTSKPILVTGGAGFVGSNLIKKLISEYPDNKIISIDNYSSGYKKNHISSSNIKYIEGDTQDIENIWKKYKLKTPSIVFHFGEFARVELSFDEPEKCISGNFNGTYEVVKFCNKRKVRLVYSGSSTKFGNGGANKHLSPYAWVKAINTELIKNYSEWFDLDYVITYFYSVYGPGQISEGKYATIIGIFEKQYREGKQLTIVKPGTQTRDFTHISDIIEGILLCAKEGKGDGYQLGAGREKSIIDAAKMFKGAKIKWLPERKGNRMSGRCPDTSKARKLGWKAKIKLEDYIDGIIKNK